MARKKTRAKPINTFVYVNVLQNGVSIADGIYPLGRPRTVAISSDKSSDLVIDHYPLPNNSIAFLKVSREQATLIIPFKWKGFCTTNGSPVSISPLEGSSIREVALAKGDYASIYYDDLRIMVKLSGKKPAESLDMNVSRGFRQSFSKFILNSKEDRQGLLIGGLAAAVIIGCSLLGLISRPFERPSSIRDIPEDYLLAFISPDLIKNAPEALKFKLNRRQFATSVLDHYQKLTTILTEEPLAEVGKYFPFSAEQYAVLHEKANTDIKNAMSRQEHTDHEQAQTKGVAQVVIPSVIGESMAGRMVRVVDKIEIIQEGLIDTLDKRRAISTSFPKDQEYGFEEYKNVPKGDKNAAVLAQIKPWEKVSDEQMMYQEAEKLAEKARRKQKNIIAFNDPNEQLTPDNTRCIGIEEGSRLSTFITPSSWANLDTKISLLNGSEYGVETKKEVIKEPLIGVIEPHLVEKFIRQNRYQLQLCYELALRRNEETSGVMEWKWRIDSRGSISDVALVKTNIADRHLAQCLQDKISRWRFPRPRRGAVEVSYPFEFAPHKGKG